MYNSQYNMGSISQLEYIPVELLDLLPDSYNGAYLTPFQFLIYNDPILGDVTANWISLTSFLARNEGGLVSPEVIKNAAKGFEHGLTVPAIKLTAEHNVLFAKLQKKEIVVRFKDNNGNWWVMGTKDSPATLIYNPTTGLDTAERNGYEIIIKSWSRDMLLQHP